ncbi:MAG: 50S ribosomal protein L5 [Fimbriimonadaceae bacterium]|nr:50S ribosomal protein L5 [Fimbriimonadaceae bacterium]QYK54195.1 MAG: 50S ribosomal protein L5 [Fimbriimonadaceae bacterium]
MARKETKIVSGPQGALPQPRLKKIFKEKVGPALREKFQYKSTMETPRLVKVVVNMGTGIDDKELDSALRDMTAITGQKPMATVARKSVAQFKLREGMKIGCRVTLRGDRAYHFFDKLCTVALPRIRDFQGLSPKSFDGRGNYSFGLQEQLVFPEIDYDSFDKMRGMDITICTTAKTDEEGRELLKGLGFPLRDK